MPGSKERYGASPTRTHRRLGQQVLPRRDDVRLVGQPGPRRVDPHHPRGARRRHQLHRHRRRLRRRASPRRSSARRSPAAGATTSSSPPSSTTRWARTPTSGATRAAGSCARSRTRCAGWAPTGSTSTRSTAPTRDTDIEETLSALTDLVHQGKVRYIGPSTFPASQIVEAQWVARDRNLQRFVTEQPPYSILVRAVEADVLPTCLRHGMAVMSYSPLAGGWLSGRWRKDTGQQSSSRAGRLPERFDLSNPQPAQARRRRGARAARRARPGSRSSSSPSRSCSTTRRSPRRSSARARWSSSRPSSPRPTSSSTRTCSTASTRSSRPDTINPADNSFANPALEPAARRRFETR